MNDAPHPNPFRRARSRSAFRLVWISLALAGLALGGGEATVAATFEVNSTDDTDDAACDAIHCSLREAIDAANGAAGNDVIRFDDALAGLTITLQSDLPEIVETLTLDATTLPNFACQTAMQLMIDGTNAQHGLVFEDTAVGSAVRGLVLGNFSSGRAISLYSDGNVVQCNFIGTDVTGLVAARNSTGLFLGLSASDNLIGTDGDGVDDELERNVISGNDSAGLRIDGTEALLSELPLPARNTIAGNYVGPGVDGATAVGNGLGLLLTATDANIIGTDGDGNGFDANERNVISGNFETGFFLSGNIDNMPDPIEDRSVGNVIAGNYIGVDATGLAELPNGTVANFDDTGLWLDFGAVETVVGTDGDGVADLEERNVISGNGGIGLNVEDANSRFNIIAGNYIGVGADGETVLPNASGDEFQAGLRLLETFFNRIGTDGDGVSDELERNVIAGNASHGILLLGQGIGSDRSVIAGNYIGVDATGTRAAGNALDGISVTQASSSNLIGTDGDGLNDAAERNVISGNGGIGIRIRDGNARENVVAGNFIGTDATGTAALPNVDGVNLSFSAALNRVGTDGDGSGDLAERNVISGNSNHGMAVAFNALKNIVAGNYIGANAFGNAALGNGNRGLNVASGAQGNLIGGDTLEEGNYIVGNATDGVRFNTNGSSPGVVNAFRYNTLGELPNGDAAANGDNNIELNALTVTQVANNRIYNSPASGLQLNSADPDLDTGSTGNCLVGNASGAQQVGMDNTLFQDNWWGAADGPSGVGPGSGDPVTDGLIFTPFLTVEPADCVFVARADLSVSKTDDLLSIAPGQSSTYSVVVSNAGPVDDPAAELVDALPGDLDCTYTSVAEGGASGNTTSGSGDLLETLDLPAGGSVTYTFECTVDPGASGSIVNTATATSSLTDPFGDNNSATDTTAVVPTADISVSKIASGTEITAGGSITYTIVASNAGPVDDPAVELSDSLPAELDCAYTAVAEDGASGQTESGDGDLMELLDLPVGGSVTYTLICAIDPLAEGSLSNTATVVGSLLDPEEDNNSATENNILGALFADDFETGDTSAWSSTVMTF